MNLIELTHYWDHKRPLTNVALTLMVHISHTLRYINKQMLWIINLCTKTMMETNFVAPWQ